MRTLILLAALFIGFALPVRAADDVAQCTGSRGLGEARLLRIHQFLSPLVYDAREIRQPNVFAR